MQELEKILEEIDQNQVMLKPFDEEDRPTGIINVDVVKGIIRKYLSRENDPEITRLSRDNDGWIPVEDRLPEDGTYLCTLAGELCGIEEPFTGMCGIENGIWDEPDCVIAWRPLPEPYKPERNRP